VLASAPLRASLKCASWLDSREPRPERSKPCRWIVTAAGALFILAGVIANMSIYFRPTSLFNTLVMLILLVGGLGLIARALQPHPAAKSN